MSTALVLPQMPEILPMMPVLSSYPSHVLLRLKGPYPAHLGNTFAGDSPGASIALLCPNSGHVFANRGTPGFPHLQLS